MSRSLKDTKNLTFLALMLAITIVLDLTPLGALPLGSISATVVHIPTIITGVLLGPVAGWILGTMMGIISLIHAVTRPVSVIDPLFINPLVSVLPRMLVGVVACYVYRMLCKALKAPASAFVAGVAGSAVNTGLVFLMLYLIYAREVTKRLGVAFKTMLLSVLTTNAIAEAVLAGILTMAITMAYNKYRKIIRE
ncbi:ECF transporter S component [Eubacteriales bacterium mix99]|jgi:uncharacterized membrane protein